MKSLLQHFLFENTEQNPLSTLAADMEDLLNHTRSTQHWNTEDGPSLLNYGIPSWVGKPISAKVLKKLAEDIKQALMTFEPRLEPSSIQVHPIQGTSQSLGVYQLEIQATLRDNFIPIAETDHLEWFVHIDPHYGQARLFDTSMQSRLLK